MRNQWRKANKHLEDESYNQSIRDLTRSSNHKSDGQNTNQAAKAKRKVFAKLKNEQKRTLAEQDFASKYLKVQAIKKSHKPGGKSKGQSNQQAQEAKMNQIQFYRISAGILQQLGADKTTPVATLRRQCKRTRLKRTVSKTRSVRLFNTQVR